jgi:hypothetical protein
MSGYYGGLVQPKASNCCLLVGGLLAGIVGGLLGHDIA